VKILRIQKLGWFKVQYGNGLLFYSEVKELSRNILLELSVLSIKPSATIFPYKPFGALTDWLLERGFYKEFIRPYSNKF